MKIILLQNIKSLGSAGDVREVADGYARNFLFPRKLAEIATPEAVAKANETKKKTEEQEKKELEKLKILAQKYRNQEIIISMKEKKGKLFGSVGKKEIAEKLGGEIKEDMVELGENIKEVGEKEAIINFGDNIKAKIKVNIQGEK
jgi:large subunit ribosomal protein L9